MSGKIAVAIVHYHLRPGGVTRVIERAVESLGDNVDVLVLTGEAPAPGDVLTPLTEPFQSLEYCDYKLQEAKKLAEDLRFTARCLLGRDPDVWHIHNHALGKNSFTPQFVWHLAKAGCRLLLQPHDFAEDGRPENYRLLREHLGNDLNSILYPVADHVWYAPINFRDKAFLEGIGLSNVHELPNAVTKHVARTFQSAQGRQESLPHKTIVYPARAIRRKNIGEFLLWSLLVPEGYRFISTLAPDNPKARPIYDEWVAFAEELNLPVEFDVGRKHDFSELVQNAEALISTSIAEGFGLAFLEPWLDGKMLMGRNIPEITRDFADDGLDLSTLYTTLPVPLEWVGEAAFYKTLKTTMQTSYATYSKAWKSEYFEQARDALVGNSKVDFGILSEPFQRKVIRHLANNPADHKQLPTLDILTNETLIEKNRTIAEKRYDMETYGKRLLGIYQQLAATQPDRVTSVNAVELLNEFLKPELFNLLRT